VAHGEEDWVLEAVVAEEVLVEQEHADVGGVPGGDQPHREEAAVPRRGTPRAAGGRRGAALGRHGSSVAAAAAAAGRTRTRARAGGRAGRSGKEEVGMGVRAVGGLGRG